MRVTSTLGPSLTTGMTHSWANHLSDWNQYLLIAGTPITTIRLRMYHLQRVAREVQRSPSSITFPHLSDWLADQDWQPNTRKSVRSSLRAFYAWAIATGRVTESPAHLLPPVRVPRAKPRPTPEEAYRYALGVADDRAQLAILLAGACGLRRTELAQARTDHVEEDLLGCSLRVVGKGGHVRLVPLPADLADMILNRAEGWLFPSVQGGHLTPHHLSKLVSRALPGNLTTHTLRHRCGTRAYEGTKDLRAVQELLGHAKPETTAVYTQVSPLSVRLAMEAAC